MKNNKVKIVFVLFLSLAFCFSACTWTQNLISKLKGDGGSLLVASNSKDKNVKEATPEDLFTLNILEKVNNGERIYVLGEVISREKYNVSNVIIKLKLVNKDFQTILEHSYILANLLGKDKAQYFEKGESKKFLLSAPVLEATDFELELLWGSEALGEVNNINQNIDSVKNEENVEEKNEDEGKEEFDNRKEILKMTNLYFKQNEVQGSNPSNPEYYFTISGEFENLSEKLIKEISLSVSFRGKNTNAKLDGEEELLEIKDVLLVPHGKKKFEMELETVLNKDEVRNYKPEIKIVNFSY